jgi:alkylated DNA repair dioxygenase AlkB
MSCKRLEIWDLGIKDGSVEYIPSFFPRQDADRWLQVLLECGHWKQSTIKVFSKTYKIPRLETWYADTGVHYTYSGTLHHPTDWFQELLEIRMAIKEEFPGFHFNSALANLYRDGNDSVGWHSDDEPELGKDPVIASVSLGEARKFRLRHKDYKENGLKEGILLEHGSLLLMKGTTQHYWKHEVPKAPRIEKPRVNLTFRTILG